jgi:hypothetical protein
LNEEKPERGISNFKARMEKATDLKKRKDRRSIRTRGSQYALPKLFKNEDANFALRRKPNAMPSSKLHPDGSENKTSCIP